ncbi:MAG: type VI secretion system-associated protein TagF [Acetobacteraceae bacterium]|nr:type VI secretion system-associated protein TagF [Acetobacteraceae bacterium]
MTTAVGFYGKIPSRGDFVRAGLPSSFVEPWDAWLQTVLPAARATLGDDWDAVWLKAPVWRFLLPAGHCGPAAVLGLWMPSVDAAGRQFPLTFAAMLRSDTHPKIEAAKLWLDQMETAGREAIAFDFSPQDLTANVSRHSAILRPLECDGAGRGRLGRQGATHQLGRWWIDGGQALNVCSTELRLLPEIERFRAMLRAEALFKAQ